MTEACHHYSSTTGRKCKAIATTMIRSCLSNDSAGPKYWSVVTCNKHAEGYIHAKEYEVITLR